MRAALPIPDDLAGRIGEAGDVSRRALEAPALAEYEALRRTRPELRRRLGYGTRGELENGLPGTGGRARGQKRSEEPKHVHLR